MSQLDNVRQSVRVLAQNADRLGNQLTPFTQKFTQESQKVIAAIGNTATGTDKQIASILAQASKDLQQTVAALKQVKQAGDQWAGRA